MSDLTLQDLDRELARQSERIAAQGLDLGRTRRRIAWLRRLPWLKLAAATLICVAVFALGEWVPALLVALRLMPDRIHAVLPGNRTGSDTPAAEDLLDAQLTWLEKQLARERLSLLTNAAFTAVLTALGLLGVGHAQAWLLLGALLGVYATLRFAVVYPPLQREFADLGGREQSRWLLAAITASFLLAAPFLVVGGLVYDGVRRLLGARPRQ